MDELLRKRERLRENGSILVVASGCFDVIHCGHVDYLRKAKLLGDVLWVGLNDDESIRWLKGPSRPLNSNQCRKEVIEAIRYVDEAFLYQNTESFLSLVKPDIWVKGGDYTYELLNQREVNAVKNAGGKVVIIPIKYSTSSSSIIGKL